MGLNGGGGGARNTGLKRMRCPSCGSVIKKGMTNCECCGVSREETDRSVLAHACLDDATLTERLRVLSNEMKIFGAASAGSALIALAQLATEIFALMLIGFAAAIVFLYLAINRSAKIKKLVGINIVKGVLNEALELERYEQNQHINEDCVRGAELIGGGWNEISGSDLVSGKYRGSKIRFSDIKLVRVERHTDSKGNTHETRTTVFEGQWIICELGKRIDHSLRLRENSEKLFGKGYRKSHSTIQTENMEFNSQFQIIADDDHTAFYILTPHFMEYIMSADRKAGGQTFYCFDGDSVQIALNTSRNLFEVKTAAGSVSNISAVREKMRGDLRFITDVIDEMMLNKYLFGKEN